MPNQGGPVICIVYPNDNTYSETFIRAHVERLPARVRVLYGGYYPRFRQDKSPLLPSPATRPQRIMRAILRRVGRLPAGHFEKMPVKRFLLESNIDAVMAEYGPTGVHIMKDCKEAGVPLIVHFHGYDAYSAQTLEQYGPRYPELFKNAAALIAVSRDMQSQLLQLGASEEKVCYNPYGVDTSLFQGADPGQARRLFVAVGRFVDKKGPHLTLLAFAKVLKHAPEARLMMVGDGPLWESCKQLVRALGIEDAVDLPGAGSHDEVATTMRRARAFVQHSLRTSYGDSEGTPVAILEAGATGLPVVATRHAGIQDVVVDGETGFLVAEGDVDGMAKCMIELAKEPDLAARLGKAARERICTEFTMEKSISKLWYIIETAIERWFCRFEQADNAPN